MREETLIFKDVALLITHYNRSLSLERLLKSFEDIHIRFNEIIVSDDCSDEKHLTRLNQLKEKHNFKLVSSDKNRGLGNNINKGQQAVTSPFTLYIQEDFVPKAAFRQRLKDAIDLIQKDTTIDMVRFYAYRKHPYLAPIKNGFSEIRFCFWWPSYWQFHCYSDHPHLKRSNFCKKFGNYAEGFNVDITEFKMVISFLKRKGKAVIHEDFQKIFDQINSVQEPSQASRKEFRKLLQSQNCLLIPRIIYRNTKARVRYLFWQTS